MRDVNSLLSDVPCGCYEHAAGASMEGTVEGHPLCSLSGDRALAAEQLGIVEREFTDGVWRWRVRQAERLADCFK